MTKGDEIVRECITPEGGVYPEMVARRIDAALAEREAQIAEVREASLALFAVCDCVGDDEDPKYGVPKKALRVALANAGDTAFVERIQAAERERLARWWDQTEARAAEAHTVYQDEAHRRGDVRHADDYKDLPEPTKEWDRVLVRWVAAAIRALGPLPPRRGT